jgi:hypothetical protein
MRTATFLSLAAGALCLAACSSGKPAISSELAAAETLPVKKKLFILFSGERLDFGDYTVHKVRRDSSQSIERPKYSRIAVELHEKYTFRMSGDGSGNWNGACESDANRLDEIPFIGPLREQGYKVQLRCELARAGAGQPWSLQLVEQDTSGGVLQGHLTNGTQSLRVQGTRLLGDRTVERSHTGFEFYDQDRVVGGVVLARGDKVLFHPSADDRMKQALAAAAAALLLYLDSNDRMRDIVEARLQSERQMFL